uniref:site-specific DNA-methyltransferase (cytosine-N(4)-specific) n=1 Tax=viral metagenome TaxID=1070528 RepID=A0A6M3LCR3_9ZZZZ
MDINKVYLGDCLEIMTSIPDKSIDMVLTSPPYDNLRTYGGNLQWNFEGIAKELYRVTKDGGVVVWVVGDATVKGSETGTSFKQALYFKSIGFSLHDTMIYQTNKPPMNGNRYQQDFEYMFIFSHGTPKTFNPIKINTLHPNVLNAGGNRAVDGSKKKRNRINRTGQLKVKGNIWYLPRSSQSGDEFSREHPATFPESLAHDHILSWSNEGDIILDPMAGSGTVGKMAKQLKRNYILIEKEPKYYEIILKRLSPLDKQVVLV